VGGGMEINSIIAAVLFCMVAFLFAIKPSGPCSAFEPAGHCDRQLWEKE
jgi:hypothetical protein